MRKRLFTAVIAATMVFSLAACNKKDTTSASDATTQVESGTVESSTAETTTESTVESESTTAESIESTSESIEETSSESETPQEPIDSLSGYTQTQVLDMLRLMADNTDDPYTYGMAHTELVENGIDSDFAIDCILYFISNIDCNAFPEHFESETTETDPIIEVTTEAETTTQAETTTTEAETTTTEPVVEQNGTSEWDLSGVQTEGDGVYNRYFWDIIEKYVGEDMTSGNDMYTAYAYTIYLCEDLICRVRDISYDGFNFALESKYGADMKAYELPIPRTELVKIVAAKFNLDPVMVDKAFFTAETCNGVILNEEGLCEVHNFEEDGYTNEELYGGSDVCLTFRIW